MKILKSWNWESPTTRLILLFGVVAKIVIPLFQLAQIVIPAGGNRYLSWRKSLAEQNYRFHYGNFALHHQWSTNANLTRSYLILWRYQCKLNSLTRFWILEVVSILLVFKVLLVILELRASLPTEYQCQFNPLSFNTPYQCKFNLLHILDSWSGIKLASYVRAEKDDQVFSASTLAEALMQLFL